MYEIGKKNRLEPLCLLSTPPSLKTRLKNGETLYGIFLFSFFPTIAKIVGLAGYDFVVVDMEHGYGVDCLQLGPRDLSASMGNLWNPSHEKVREMVRKAEKGALGSRGGAYLGGIAMQHDSPQKLRARGYKTVVGGVDIGMFRRLLVEDVKNFKLEET